MNKRIALIALSLFLSLKTAEKPQKTESLSEIERTTREDAANEREKAQKAEQDFKQAHDAVEHYQELEAKALAEKDPIKRDEALKNERIWSTKAVTEQEIAQEAKTEAEKLEKKADDLSEEQKELAQEFNPVGEQQDLLKEKFEQCIKTNISKGIKSKKLSQAEAKKLGQYIEQLTEKVSELTRYESSNFYKSDQIKSDEWKRIHKQTLANPEKADSYYLSLLKSINELSTLIKGILKTEGLEIPTTAENDVCALKLFKGFEEKLKKIQDTVDSSDMSWNN